MALATLSIDLEARLAGLEAGLDKASRIAQQNADKISKSFEGIKSFGAGLASSLTAAFSVSALTAFIRTTADGIDALNDLKEATGASIENLSALEDIAARTGTSFDTVGVSLTKFNGLLNSAKGGSETERVLKAIGLSAEDLRKIDPAEALQRVAVALSKYSDDGNKARIVQELFGKSVREVAPFLNDLAEAGKLNGTVTSKQAEEAKKFNEQLLNLEKNAKDAARSLVSGLLPALNGLFERANRAGGLGGLAKDGLKLEIDEIALQRISDEIASLTKEAVKLKRQLDFSDARGLPQNRDTVDRYEEVRRKLVELQAEALRTGERLRAVADKQSPLPAPGQTSANKPPAPRVPDAPQMERVRRLYSDPKNEALTNALKALENTDIGKLRDLEAQLSELFNLQRETRGDPAVVEAIRKTREEIDKLTAPKTTAILDPQEEQKSSFLRSEKAAYEEIKYEIKGLDEFAQQAGRNIQDALGDTLARTLKGDFDSIGQLWGNLILNMIAQASAAQLNNYLFGNIFSGGTNPGAIGGFLAPFLGAKAVGVDYVPQDGFAVLHRGERVVTADDNRKGAWGGGGRVVNQFSYTYNVEAGVSRAELISALQAMERSTEEKTLTRLRRVGVA